MYLHFPEPDRVYWRLRLSKHILYLIKTEIQFSILHDIA